MAGLISEVSLSQANEFIARLDRAGLDYKAFKLLLGDDEAVEHMLDALKGKGVELTNLFLSPSEQIARVREWNDERGWCFTDEDFAAIEESIPDQRAEGLVTPVLVPYLSDADEVPGYIRTFGDLWLLTKKQHENSWNWDGYNNLTPEKLRLLPGIEHKPGLAWEVIDFGTNQGKEPKDIRSPKVSPHAGVLAASALFPNWVRAMNGKEVPYVWISGYQVTVPGNDPWQVVPDLGFDRRDRKVDLGYDWDDGCSALWSVPVCRE